MFQFQLWRLLQKKVTLAEARSRTKKKVLTFLIIIFQVVVKDGVDILTMNSEREPIDTESTLELILNTLCRAF